MQTSIETAPEARWTPVTECWVCGGTELVPYHSCRMEFSEFAEQDPDLHRYTGQRVSLVKCRRCGFGQPEALPSLPQYFERMYDQRWSAEWVEREFAATYKDFIFTTILRELDRRVPAAHRTLLDVGAHAGRFMHLAQHAGWSVEGIELNPRTAAYAALRTGAEVHQINAHALARSGRRYGAVVLTDVLEHIPEPTRLLASLAAMVESRGCIAVKVPNGPAQVMKEHALAAISSHRVSLAENLVHVNHFSPRSLARALESAGLACVEVKTAAPELPPADARGFGAQASRALRMAIFAAASLPGAVHSPLALHLQAYATKA
jgi:2-polyprenyl-3-methyl-5-hydroxy-6-metoxy-1,4-benzoquinol methylase